MPGSERYWDGSSWTDNRRPGAAPLPPPPPPPPPSPASYAAYPPPPPGYGGPVGAKPDNYLVWTILSTLLCCLPVGAIGIYYSTQVDKLWAQGDVAGAYDRARTARNLAIGAAVFSLVLFVVWILFLIVLGDWNFDTYS